MKRRNIVIGLGVVAARAAAGGAWWMTAGRKAPQTATAEAPSGMVLATAAGDMPIYDDDHILGDAAAPVTFIEYASLTCGHCGAFHRETLPEVKAKWIEEGRARMVFRHYPLDQLALRAAAVSECMKGETFFGFLDVLFKNQEKWAANANPLQIIGQYAALAGLDAQAYQLCVSDEAAIDRILKRQTDGRDRYNIASTPSFVVNGTPVVGNQTYEEFNKVLEAAASKAS